MKIPFLNLEIKKNEPRGLEAYQGNVLLSSFAGQEGIRVAPRSLWAVYRQNADVFACVREWSQAVGDGGYQIADKNDHETEAKAKPYIEQVFQNSGGFFKWRKSAIRDLGISGNSFWELVESQGTLINSLKRLDPRTMYIVADKHGQIIKYIQKIHGHEDVVFEPEQLLHIQGDSDPDNELWGMSPLETALWEARTDIASAQSNYAFFENDAVPSHVYIINDGVDREDMQALKDQIQGEFSGAKNKHKSTMLKGVTDIKTIQLSQRDMEFIQGRKFNTDKICSVYGVPKFMLGYTETVNYSAGTKLLQKFYRGTIQPLETLLVNAINTQLFPRLKVEQAEFYFLPQRFGEEVEETKLALEEFKSGALTLRQYKTKTGQEITEEDERDPMLDSHIIQGGGGMLLEDVGIEPISLDNPETAENMLKALENKFDGKL